MDFSLATTLPSVFTSLAIDMRFMRTRVRPGSKPQLSAAIPARAISASASSIASPVLNEKETESSNAGARIRRKVISALMPSVPESPMNRPARSGP